MGARNVGVWVVSVDLSIAYNGHVRFRSGYCVYVHIAGDQDREGGYLVSEDRNFAMGLFGKRTYGLFTSDGRSYFDQWPEAHTKWGRVIPIDMEIVGFDPDHLIPLDDS